MDGTNNTISALVIDDNVTNSKSSINLKNPMRINSFKDKIPIALKKLNLLQDHFYLGHFLVK